MNDMPNDIDPGHEIPFFPGKVVPMEMMPVTVFLRLRQDEFTVLRDEAIERDMDLNDWIRRRMGLGGLDTI